MPRLSRDLAEWWTARRSKVKAAPKVPRTEQGKRWSLWGIPTEDIVRLKELIESANRLTSLMQHPGWKDVLAARAFYQDNAKGRAFVVTQDDRTRRDAVVEHQAIEGFFAELALRVRRGQEAQTQVKTPPIEARQS